MNEGGWWIIFGMIGELLLGLVVGYLIGENKIKEEEEAFELGRLQLAEKRQKQFSEDFDAGYKKAMKEVEKIINEIYNKEIIEAEEHTGEVEDCKECKLTGKICELIKQKLRGGK